MKPLKESSRPDSSNAALHVLEISNHTDHRSKCKGEFSHNHVLFNKSGLERPTRNMKPLLESSGSDHSKGAPHVPEISN